MEATQKGIIQWRIGKTGRGACIDTEYVGGYQCEVSGLFVDIYLEEKRNTRWLDRKPNDSIAVVLKVSFPLEGLTLSMTSDPEIVTADIREPELFYLTTLYFLVMRSWHKWVNGSNSKFDKMYPKKSGEARSVYPEGWRISDIFSSKPVTGVVDGL